MAMQRLPRCVARAVRGQSAASFRQISSPQRQASGGAQGSGRANWSARASCVTMTACSSQVVRDGDWSHGRCRSRTRVEASLLRSVQRGRSAMAGVRARAMFGGGGGMQEEMMKKLMSDPKMRETAERMMKDPKVLAETQRLMTDPAARQEMLDKISDPKRKAQAEALLRGDISALDNDPELKSKMEQISKMQSGEAFKDPNFMKQMSQQMSQMQNMMKDPDFAAQLAALRDDPEVGPKLQQLSKDGPAGMMKLMNDTEFLQQLGVKLAPLEKKMAAAQQSQTTTSSPPSSPPSTSTSKEDSVETLFDAARLNDVEAAADLVAVNAASVNEQDDMGRTPLHFACAYDAHDVLVEILNASPSEVRADLELRDAKANTALHYAAGYGRLDAVKSLVEAGADVKAKNDSGKTAADLAKMDERNPVGLNEELIAKLTR